MPHQRPATLAISDWNVYLSPYSYRPGRYPAVFDPDKFTMMAARGAD